MEVRYREVMPTSQRLNQTFHLREYRRFPMHCVVYFSTDGVSGTGTMWNLSLGGLRMESDVWLASGRMLKLFIMPPECDHAIVVDHATVCWSRDHDFGLAIRQITPHDAVHLKDFMTTRISAPPSAY